MLLEVLYLNMEETKGQCWCDSVKHYINMMLMEVLYRTAEETKGKCWCDRFPNMVVANLTRDSVRAALARGITAEQVSSVALSSRQFCVCVFK